jgi:hypothetical protein
VEYEKLKRDRNRLKMELKMQIMKMVNILAENEVLRKRNNTLTALENALPQRIARYKEMNAPAPVIMELEFINNMLAEEKNRQKEEETQE